MCARRGDRSAGDVDYGQLGRCYSNYRQPDPRITGLIRDAVGDAQSVLNVGAGAGSYEPISCAVTAVEPSASMRAQRPSHLVQAIDATAEQLPFPDKSFDAAMATFTVHQWSNLSEGLGELRRVTRGPIVILTCDPLKVRDFWLNAYIPEVLDAEARRYPDMTQIVAGLGGSISVKAVPIPFDCTDGFNEAYYGRPEMFLDEDARLSCSAWSFATPRRVSESIEKLSDDLRSGAWDRSYGTLRKLPSYEGCLILVTQA